MCHFGFPVDLLDLRFIVKSYLDRTVKSYLDRTGRKVMAFSNNLPGKEWARSFLNRNNYLTVRLSANIKRKRAEISETKLDKYFEHLESSLAGVPSSNIWNYDETNLTDEPGRERVIAKRGSKYSERIMNASKSATSLMFCGSATGEILPPYVVYKSESIWLTWTEGGPAGTRYNRSKSRWFDQTCFEDWFLSLLLPRLKRQEGKKVMIGDNLSSHISQQVLQKCEENNISFVALPPNSTHLT